MTAALDKHLHFVIAASKQNTWETSWFSISFHSFLHILSDSLQDQPKFTHSGGTIFL